MTPAEQATAAPFTFLAYRGWRPCGGGEWMRGDQRMTATEAIARELVADMVATNGLVNVEIQGGV